MTRFTTPSHAGMGLVWTATLHPQSRRPVPCHVGHLAANLGKALGGTDVKDPEVVPLLAACFCVLLNQKRMAACAACSADSLAPIRKGTPLGVGLFIFITNSLHATSAPRGWEQSGLRVSG